MKLIFEKSKPGRGCAILPPSDVPTASLPDAFVRDTAPRLPEIAEGDIARHYTQLAKRAHGVNCGFYPLGSCTMKYNPKIDEVIAALPGFVNVHPLQPKETVCGCMEVLALAKQCLCEIAGMDDMTLQPAAGAHGEFTGLLLIKAYHQANNQGHRDQIIVPDSAHGTNPASAAMAGYQVINVPSAQDGCVDLTALRAAINERTAGLMLTNPNTVGLFDRNILEITRLIHETGGLNYYDGANLNAIMGIARPGDMGFDVVHLNLHKTFATPHGGGGPGAGPVGCKAILAKFLPHSTLGENGTAESIGQVKAFYGNFSVIVKALTYILTLGANGIRETSENAVLNANYLMHRIKDVYPVAFDAVCMHEFVVSLEKLKTDSGISALDAAKALLDFGMHPPTMYFPLIVHEALMLEPTETESIESLDEAAAVYREVYTRAVDDPQAMHDCPLTTPVRRLDEVTAARNPRLRYTFDT